MHKKFFNILFFSNVLIHHIHSAEIKKEFETLEAVYDFWAPNYKKLVEITDYKI